MNLDSVTTGQSESIRWSSRNSRIDGNSSETGTTVSGGTNVAINAGGDITARAATLNAGTDLSLDAGGKLLLYAGQDQTYAQTEHSQRSGMSYNRLDASSSETTLARTTLSADNVKLHSGGDTTLGAVKVDANTLDIQAGGQLNLLTQTTSSSKSINKSSGDAAFVDASTKGNIDETTNYNQFDVASVHLQANGGINANVAKGTDLNTLAQQPGMAWVNQLISDPALVNSTQWQTVEEAHKKWQTDQSSLGPVSSALVMLVVAVATAGAGTAAAGTAGAGTTAGTGMAGAMGLTAGQTAILAGAMQAGITTLVGQATISAFNNGGNLAKVFDELGSSQSVKNILGAMVTGGVLQGLNAQFGLTGPASSLSTSQLISRGLIDGAAASLTRAAINGTSLEDALSSGLLNGVLNAGAQAGANFTGLNLDGFAASLAHALVGCAVGAGSAAVNGGTSSGTGCSAGAAGAVAGHLAGQFINPTSDPALANETIEFGQLIGGLAGALVGGDAASVNVGANAGANAVENNQFAFVGRGVKLVAEFCATQPAWCLTAGAGSAALASQLATATLAYQAKYPGLSASTAQDMAFNDVVVGPFAASVGNTVGSWFVSNPGFATASPGFGAGDVAVIHPTTGGAVSSPYMPNTTGGSQLSDPDLIGTAADSGYQIAGESSQYGTTSPTPNGPLTSPVVISEAQGNNLPVSEVITAGNGLQVVSNPKHTPGNPGYSPTAGTEPVNSLDLFNNSVPGGDGVRYALDANGAINRFF